MGGLLALDLSPGFAPDKAAAKLSEFKMRQAVVTKSLLHTASNLTKKRLTSLP